MVKRPPPAPTANAIGPCPIIIQISRTPWQNWTGNILKIKSKSGYMYNVYEMSLTIYKMSLNLTKKQYAQVSF